jgi:predicted dehydrogenase
VVTVFPNSGTPAPVALPADDGYYYELQEFVNAVDGGTDSTVVGPDEAAKSVRLCLKEIESVDTGKPVTV